MTHPRPDESRQPSAPTGWFGIDAASVDEPGEPAQHGPPDAPQPPTMPRDSAPQPAKRRGRRAANVEPDAYPAETSDGSGHDDGRRRERALGNSGAGPLAAEAVLDDAAQDAPGGGYRGWTAEAAAGIPQQFAPPQAPNAWRQASEAPHQEREGAPAAGRSDSGRDAGTGWGHGTTAAAPASPIPPATPSVPAQPAAPGSSYGSGPRSAAGAWGASPLAPAAGGWGAPTEAVPPVTPEAAQAAPVQPEAFEAFEPAAPVGLDPVVPEALGTTSVQESEALSAPEAPVAPASAATPVAPEAQQKTPTPSAPRRGRRASSAVPDAEPVRDVRAAETTPNSQNAVEARPGDPQFPTPQRQTDRASATPAPHAPSEAGEPAEASGEALQAPSADRAAPVEAAPAQATPEPPGADGPDAHATAEDSRAEDQQTDGRPRGRRAAAGSVASWRERVLGPLSAGQWVDAGIVGLVAYAAALVTALLVVVLALPSASRGGPGGMAAHGGFFQMAVQTVNMGFLHDLGLRGVGTILVLYPLIVPAVAVVAMRRVSPRLQLATHPATAGLTLIQGFAASVFFTLLATLLASVLPVGGFAAPAVALSALGFAGMIATITLGHAAGSGLLPQAATLALRQTGEHLGSLAAAAGVCGLVALAVSGPLFWLFPYLLPAIAGDAVALSHLSVLSSWASGASASIFGLMPLGLALLCVVVALVAIVVAGARWRLRVAASDAPPLWTLPLSYALLGLAGTLVFRWGGIGYAHFAVADLVGPALWTFAVFGVVGLLVELSARLLAPSLPPSILNALGRGLVPAGAAGAAGVAHQAMADDAAPDAGDLELRFIDVSRQDGAAQRPGVERRSWSPIADPDRRPDVVVERAKVSDARSDDDAADDLDASGYWTGHRSPLPSEYLDLAGAADAAIDPDSAVAESGEAKPEGWVAVRPPRRGN